METISEEFTVVKLLEPTQPTNMSSIAIEEVAANDDDEDLDEVDELSNESAERRLNNNFWSPHTVRRDSKTLTVNSMARRSNCKEISVGIVTDSG